MTTHRSVLGMILLCLTLAGLDGGVAFVVTRARPLVLVPKDSILRKPLNSPIHNIGNRCCALRLEPQLQPEPDDTVRVRIWRALASSFGKEMTLKQLGAIVEERRTGELRAHLQHVEKQAKTLKNKNAEWRERRGLSAVGTKGVDKIRVRTRQGKKKEVYIKLE